MDISDFSQINEAINILIDIKVLFRQKIPIFDIDTIEKQKIKISLSKLNEILKNLNEKFGIQTSNEEKNILNLKNDLKNALIIVNSSKNRKKLLELGLNTAQILVSGGPVTVEDIKTLNPNISDVAFKNFQNKIDKFWKILKAKVEQSDYDRLILLIEENNVADQILLNRIDEFKKRLPISIQYHQVSSFNRIENNFLS